MPDPETKAVLLVHLYGQIREYGTMGHALPGRVTAFAGGLRAGTRRVLEHNIYAGSFGTWGAFSFYPTKNLGAKGDAGALVTNFEEIDTRAKKLRNYGTTQRHAACLKRA